MFIASLVTKLIGEKRQWRRYKARRDALPTHYRSVLCAVERYVFHFASNRTDLLMSLLEDLADLFEQEAAKGTPIRDVVGDDPVEFADAFIRNYPDGTWISKEQGRLVRTVERVASDEHSEHGGTR